MRPLLKLLLLCALPLACVRDAAARQSPQEEFVSIVGRFAVLLPQKYAEYRPVFELEVAGQKFTSSAYRWQLAGGQQAIISYADGERAYRERRKAQEFVLFGVGREGKDMQAATPPPSLAKTVTRLFKLRYKFDKAGRAAEIRVVDEDGAEWEKNVYKPEERKYEYTFYTLSFMLTKPIDGAKARIVATLDAAGNPVEEALTTHDEPKRYVQRVGGEIYTGDTERFKTERFVHRYEFDARGNWVKRVTSSLAKGKGGGTVETPLSVTYRTLTYH